MTELVVLKSPAFGAPGDGPLPYRADHLRALGFELVWDDRRAALTGRRARLAARSEALLTPWLQAWHLRRRIRRAPATLAFFDVHLRGDADAAKRLSVESLKPLLRGSIDKVEVLSK